MIGLLHTRYIHQFYQKIRLGFPFTGNLSVSLEPEVGYFGALAMGVLGYLLTSLFFSVLTPVFIKDAGVNFLPYFSGILFTVFLSQLLSGVSFSKLFMETTLMILGYVILLASILSSVTILTIFISLISLYISFILNYHQSAFSGGELEELTTKQKRTVLVYLVVPFLYIWIIGGFLVVVG